MNNIKMDLREEDGRCVELVQNFTH